MNDGRAVRFSRRAVITGNLICLAAAESDMLFEAPNSAAMVDQFRAASRMRVTSLEREPLDSLQLALTGGGQNDRRPS